MKLLKIVWLGYLTLLFGQGYAQVVIREGEEAVYVFLADRRLSAGTPMQSVVGVNLSRATGDDPLFKSLGKVVAAETVADFKRIAGEGVLRNIQELKGLKSELEAWEYVRKTPNLSDYGLIVLNPDFGVAMGAVYKDEEVKKLPVRNVRYRAEFITADGKGNQTLTGNLVLGTPPAIGKPVLDHISEGDSAVIVSWKLKQSTSPDALLGQVWVREKANAPFQKAGYAFANRGEKDDDLTFTWQQEVKPGLSYGLFLEPQTLVHLPGPVSDTVSLISRNFKSLAQIPIASVKDTAGGIYLSWKALTPLSFFSGIVIERSRQPAEGFVVLDTIPAASTSYTDVQVLPDVLYHYRFRMLSIRRDLSQPSAYVSHRMPVRKRPIEAPEALKLNYDREGHPVISWKRVISPEVSGYQVFRTLQGNDHFELVSNLLTDPVFTDTTVRNSRIVYKYGVKTLNFENRTSELSAVVFGQPGKAIPPKTPYDVEAYTEPGKITLRWKDMASYDAYIRGYSVYRKQVTISSKPLEGELLPSDLSREGFRKLHEGLVQGVVFADKEATGGATFVYAVTATDLYGIEGAASGAKKVNAAPITLRAPEIYARPTSKGIEITWSDVLVPGVDKYLLFVRPDNKKEYALLAEIPPGREVYVNTGVKPGQRYYFAMQISGKGAKSPFGIEKSARKD